MLVELSRILVEMECRSPSVTSPASVAFYQASRSTLAPTESSTFRDTLGTLEPLPRHQFNIGVYASAYALSNVFHLPLSVSGLATSRRALAQMSSMKFGGPVSLSSGEAKLLSEFPTADGILALRSCVCRLLGSIDLSAVDSQPVCRSLTRCLEFLVRDPIILLLSMGVPESALMEGLMKLVTRQRSSDSTTHSVPSRHPVPSSDIPTELVSETPSHFGVQSDTSNTSDLIGFNRTGFVSNAERRSIGSGTVSHSRRHLMPTAMLTASHEHSALSAAAGFGLGLSPSDGVTTETHPSTEVEVDMIHDREIGRSMDVGNGIMGVLYSQIVWKEMKTMMILMKRMMTKPVVELIITIL